MDKVSLYNYTMTYMHSGAQGALPVKGNSDSMVWKKRRITKLYI